MNKPIDDNRQSTLVENKTRFSVHPFELSLLGFNEGGIINVIARFTDRLFFCHLKKIIRFT